MIVETVRTLDDWKGDAVLVRREDGAHFAVSTVVAFDTDCEETLAFRCDENGEVSDWAECAGGIGRTREETIAQLANDALGRNVDEYVEHMGGIAGALAGTLQMIADDALGRPVSRRVSE